MPALSLFFIATLVGVSILNQGHKGVNGATQETTFMQVTSQFNDMTGCSLGVLQMVSKLSCAAYCNQVTTCSLFCFNENLCSLYSAKVSSYYGGEGDTLPGECFSSWAVDKDLMAAASVLSENPHSSSYQGIHVLKGFSCYNSIDHCYVSQLSQKGYWEVSMGDKKRIKAVKIYTGKQYNFFKDVEIIIGNASTVSGSTETQLVGEGTTTVAGSEFFFNLNEPVIGSVLSIISSYTGYLSFCNVIIYPA